MNRKSFEYYLFNIFLIERKTFFHRIKNKVFSYLTFFKFYQLLENILFKTRLHNFLYLF